MAKMIDVTVKTLDSQNHLFTVSEELTVKEFKQEILPQVGIPVDQQRLIFRGRVLQDDNKISEYNVASNTVHLVQRPVQPPGAPRNDEPQRNTTQQDGMNFDGAGGGIIITAGAGPADRNTIIMGAIGDPGVQNQGNGIPRRNSAAVRLQVGNEMLNRASNVLQRLEEDDGIASAAAGSTSNDLSPTSARESGSASPTPMDVEIDEQDTFGRMIAQVAHAASAAALVAAIRGTQPGINTNAGSTDATGNATSNAATGGSTANTGAENSASVSDVNSNNDNSANRSVRRPEAPRLRELAIAVQDLLAFQERLTPFLQYIQGIIRENRAYDNTSELQSIQYVFDSVSSILHLLGHSYHAYSDLMCDFAIPPETRRLRASSSILVEQSTVVRATIPLAVPMGAGFTLPANMVNQTANAPSAAQSQPASNSDQIPFQTPQGQAVPGFNLPAHFNFGHHPTGHHSTASAPSQSQTQPAPNADQTAPLQMHGPIVPGLIQSLSNIPGVSINIQANAGIPDFGSLLGPAMGMGVGMPAALMPFLNNIQSNMQRSSGGGSGSGAATPNQMTPQQIQAQAQMQAQAQAQLQNLFGMTPSAPPAPTNSNVATESNSTGQGQSQAPPPRASTTPAPTTASTNAATNNNNAGNLNTIFGNLPRNDLMRPPFDVLLSCPSHHNNRSRQRSRPNDLHRFVNIGSGDATMSRRANQSDEPDFFESIIDYFRCSNVLIEIQPMLKDWIQGYLMRGRDTKNIHHIRTCSRSMAKKLLPFFQSFTNQIPNRNEDVIYPETFSNLVTNFYTALIQHMLQSGPTNEYRNGVLIIVEEFLMSLFSVFAISFPDNARVPEILANCISDRYFGGMSLVFRAYSKRSLTQYFVALSRIESANEPVANSPIVYRRPESEFQDAVNDSDSSFKSASGSDCALPSDIPPPTAKENEKVEVPETRVPPTFVDADNMDDDDVLDELTIPPTMRPSMPGSDSLLRHLPTEWENTVRLDIRRQLGMPEQPPFSQGFCTLFPRKH